MSPPVFHGMQEPLFGQEPEGKEVEVFQGGEILVPEGLPAVGAEEAFSGMVHLVFRDGPRGVEDEDVHVIAAQALDEIAGDLQGDGPVAFSADVFGEEHGDVEIALLRGLSFGRGAEEIGSDDIPAPRKIGYEKSGEGCRLHAALPTRGAAPIQS